MENESQMKPESDLPQQEVSNSPASAPAEPAPTPVEPVHHKANNKPVFITIGITIALVLAVVFFAKPVMNFFVDRAVNNTTDKMMEIIDEAMEEMEEEIEIEEAEEVVELEDTKPALPELPEVAEIVEEEVMEEVAEEDSELTPMEKFYQKAAESQDTAKPYVEEGRGSFVTDSLNKELFETYYECPYATDMCLGDLIAGITTYYSDEEFNFVLNECETFTDAEDCKGSLEMFVSEEYRDSLDERAEEQELAEQEAVAACDAETIFDECYEGLSAYEKIAFQESIKGEFVTDSFNKENFDTYNECTSMPSVCFLNLDVMGSFFSQEEADFYINECKKFMLPEDCQMFYDMKYKAY